MRRIKLLLIAGHGEGDPGACSLMNGVSRQEYQYTRELVGLLSGCFQQGEVDVTVYDMEKNCYKQNKAGTGPDFRQYDYVFEVHFNAKVKADGKSDGRYTGIGFYLHTGIGGVSVERRILSNVAGLGFKQWADGCFYVSNLLNCNVAYRAGVDYALLETAFIDDLDDMLWYDSHKEEVAQAIADGIIDGFGVRKEEYWPGDEPYTGATGWIKEDNGWWYVREDGTYPADGWEEINGCWYLFNKEGYMLTGLQEYRGKHYYLCEEKGSREGALMDTDETGALTVTWKTE